MKKQILDFLSKVKTGFSNLFKPHFQIVDNHAPKNIYGIITVEKKTRLLFHSFFYPIASFCYAPNVTPDSIISRERAIDKARKIISKEPIDEIRDVLYDSLSGDVQPKNIMTIYGFLHDETGKTYETPDDIIEEVDHALEMYHEGKRGYDEVKVKFGSYESFRKAVVNALTDGTVIFDYTWNDGIVYEKIENVGIALLE